MSHSDRKAKAVAYMRRRDLVSALQLGRAAVAGENWARRASAQSIEAIGLGIGATLVRSRQAVPARGNMFRIVSPAP